MTFVVKIEELSYRFGQHQALDNISLSISKGSIYGFLGPNGAGKTTTLRLLLGLLKCQHGSISLFDLNITKNRITILKQIGALIEQPSLYLHLTGRENLEVLRLSYGLPKKRIDEVLHIVDLTEAGKRKVAAYSLGMKQRLAIALAMLNDPELLILDEPTNGLDPNGIIEIRNLIKRLHLDFGKTILVSSHLLSEVEKIATHLAIIGRGKLLFEGTLLELYRKETKSSILEVLVNDPEKAIELLTPSYTVQHLDGILQVECHNQQEAAKLNSFLVEHGIKVYRLDMKKENLENLFLQTITE